ncbi:PD-(D/E)XK motif protein [Edaphobacter aggregans]|uniref:PD-(D/E)XK motif protein n=1 Tax=Edaphobacter aggregans TaxID=570835 RepID=UPI0005538E36|nr:PD-(D/E)XK motif protein [Edaphobacter aggregans]
MADGPTREQWAELRTRRPVSDDALSTIPITSDGIETQLFMAMDIAGNLHLLIPVQRGPIDSKPPDLNGLKVRHRRLETGEFLDLVASPSHEQVFTPVCKDVLTAVLVEQRDPWMAVAAIIRAWQSAWRPARQEMDKTVQVGLFGELLVLQTLMIPCLGPAAVDQWSGPESERHDFVGDCLHIEVKTTRKSRHEHEMSRLDQLRVPSGCQLLFVSIQLEQSVGGNETLASRMDAIIDLLRADAAALDNFMAKMVNLGWSEEMRNSGELLRFFVREAFVYAVDNDFPRLPDDFRPPSGVVSVRYTVDLANLPALGLEEATEIIKAGNPCYVH